MEEAVFEPRERIAALRGERGFEGRAAGLWRVGSLDGLTRTSVAIVGTRAATPLGRRLAQSFAERIGAAGCTIVSGLALGIDAAAHEGALRAGAPTVGILGGGHRRFFPRRNLPLARRMVAAGGAVLSPFPPEAAARPAQFLQRNGVVAALADAVVVIEAPARSGALNTAGWAAGRIPVFAVPGDVDRANVQGCLALIRDGATLARHAGDVLEALGTSAPPPVCDTAPGEDGLGGALLAALAGGECELDDLVASTGAPTASVLAALTLLEFAGRAERRSATRFGPGDGRSAMLESPCRSV